MDTFWRLNREQRVFELVDMESGRVLRVEVTPDAEEGSLVEYADVGGVKVHTSVVDVYRGKRVWVWSRGLGDVISGLHAEGMSIGEIERMEGMPDRKTIRRWRRMYPFFDEQMREAGRIYAEVKAEEAIGIGVESVGVLKDEVPGRKLAVETLKWAARVHDPGVYGEKLKVEASVATDIILDTGIRRGEEERMGIPSSGVGSSNLDDEVEEGEVVEEV